MDPRMIMQYLQQMRMQGSPMGFGGQGGYGPQQYGQQGFGGFQGGDRHSMEMGGFAGGRGQGGYGGGYGNSGGGWGGGGYGMQRPSWGGGQGWGQQQHGWGGFARQQQPASTATFGAAPNGIQTLINNSGTTPPGGTTQNAQAATADANANPNANYGGNSMISHLPQSSEQGQESMTTQPVSDPLMRGWRQRPVGRRQFPQQGVTQ